MFLKFHHEPYHCIDIYRNKISILYLEEFHNSNSKNKIFHISETMNFLAKTKEIK